CAWAQTQTPAGQGQTLSGRVVEAGTNTPMAGVAIAVEGTHNGVTTDSDGAFIIHLPPHGRLVISHVGFTTLKITPNTNSSLVIRMERVAAKDLGEVVVVGYGTRKKATLTGSIVQ